MNMLVKRTAGGLTLSLLMILSTWLSSCGPGKVSKDKLVSLIEHDPTLNQVQEVNGIKVRLKYCPYQLLVLQELGDANTPKYADTARLHALERKYSGQYYFRLSYSKDNKEVIRQLGSFQQYSDMLQVFSFELGRFINGSTEKNDTLSLADYAFEQDYGMSTASNAMLVFKRSDFDNAKSIRVNIGEFGLGMGSMNFTFPKDKIAGVPPLSYPGMN
jgi:hypothetical protein